MLGSRASTRGQILAASLLILLGLVAVVLTRGGSASTPARPYLASMFQDDDHLLYSSDATVGRSLDELKRLGVNQIRATVLWKNLAPDTASPTTPALASGHPLRSAIVIRPRARAGRKKAEAAES